jgi:hypothetical protein
MKKSEIIAQYVRMNRRYEMLFMPKVKRAIHTQVAAVIADLQESGYATAQANLHLTVGNQAMNRVIRTLYKTVGSRHAQVTYSRLLHDQQKGFGFNAAWVKFIEDYLARFLTSKITFAIAETTREALLRALNRGINSGLSVDGMIATLKNWPYERFQAARIVRTEVNRAANVGAKAQESTGKYEQQKEWVSVKDFRTRGHKPGDHASHVALNGVKIDANDDFVDPINGDRLQFPGDPNGSAASTINCRCQAVFVNKRDNNGNLIPKRKTTAVIYPGQIPRRQIVTI